MCKLKSMCGIAGYYGSFSIEAQQIQRCLKLMHRRGPDHADFFQHVNTKGRHVYLLSSRLSILDLEERSNQPFRLGSKVLIYNGELYNYLELKQNLLPRTNDSSLRAIQKCSCKFYKSLVGKVSINAKGCGRSHCMMKLTNHFY